MSLSYSKANNLRYKLHDIDLPQGLDRADFNALLTAGVRDVLMQELDALADRREAEKSAAIEVSGAANWAAVANRIRNRDNAIRSGVYVERVT